MSSNDKSIQVGDLCRVVSGLAGDQSPNIGLIVKITRYVGYRDTQDHVGTGRVWEGENEFAEAPPNQKITRRIEPGRRDYLEHWLVKIPGNKDSQSTNSTKELENTP